MNINLIKLKGIGIELSGIRKALERIADCMEMELSDKGFTLHPPQDNPSIKESFEYVDEEMDWARENAYIKDKESDNGER